MIGCKKLPSALTLAVFVLMVGCANVDPSPIRGGATIEYGETGSATEGVCDERSGWGQC